MFEALVPGYDRFNALSSLGLVSHWRKEAVRYFKAGSSVLDVGTGTGGLADRLLKRGCRVTGVDFSEGMVLAAQKRFENRSDVSFVVAGASELPFEGLSFDGLCSSFVIRNLFQGDLLQPSLREFFRVLKPGATMVHLELTRPRRGFISWGHRVYLKYMLPIIGWSVFKNRWPDDYLTQTIHRLPDPGVICQWMRWAGFKDICHYPLTGGIAGLFIAHK